MYVCVRARGVSCDWMLDLTDIEAYIESYMLRGFTGECRPEGRLRWALSLE